jgi:prepilin peptidase CpaA
MIPLAPALSALAATIAIVAAGFDYRERRVPNWLTLTGVVAGIALNSGLAHFVGLWTSLEGFGLALLIYLPLYMLRGVGGGDLKLMAALGAIVGPKNWITIFLLTALLGGVAALCVVIYEGRLLRTLRNVGLILGSLLRGRAPYEGRPELDVRSDQGMRLPHGIVICVATLTFLAAVAGRVIR